MRNRPADIAVKLTTEANEKARPAYIKYEYGVEYCLQSIWGSDRRKYPHREKCIQKKETIVKKERSAWSFAKENTRKCKKREECAD